MGRLCFLALAIPRAYHPISTYTYSQYLSEYTHNTRQNSKNNIAFNMVNSDSGKRMFQYSGGQIWNNLPTLRQSPSQMTFKLNLKKHILA